MSWSGKHMGFTRGDGEMHEDQRRLGFSGLVDHALPIVIIGLLVWLCVSTMTLQQQVAVLVERTTNQSGRVDRNTMDIQGLRAADAELQRELEEVKRR